MRQWLEQLSTAQFATAACYVDLLAGHGPLLGEPYTRQLDRKLREPGARWHGAWPRNTEWRMRTMTERSSWADLREQRMSEPGAQDAYQAARLAYELGRTLRELREQRDWSQTALARAAGMTQSAVARFEAGGTTPTLPVLERLAQALDADLVVQVAPRAHAA